MNLDVLFEPSPDLPRLGRLLDEMGPLNRLTTIRAWHRHQLAALYEAAGGFRPVSREDLVPSAKGAEEVIHHGRNSLPLFTSFQKRFCLLDDELIGYNHQSTSVFTGPGYFVVAPHSVAGEMAIDYRKLPKQVPKGWPALQGNNRGLIPRLVFGGMVDIVRGISTHVTIGRAMKKGKAIDAWFVLTRDDR